MRARADETPGLDNKTHSHNMQQPRNNTTTPTTTQQTRIHNTHTQQQLDAHRPALRPQPPPPGESHPGAVGARQGPDRRAARRAGASAFVCRCVAALCCVFALALVPLCACAPVRKTDEMEQNAASSQPCPLNSNTKHTPILNTTQKLQIQTDDSPASRSTPRRRAARSAACCSPPASPSRTQSGRRTASARTWRPTARSSRSTSCRITSATSAGCWRERCLR